MFYYLLGIITLLALIGAVVFSILYWRGNRIFRSREQSEIEEGLQKIGKNTRWGVAGGADNEIHNRDNHSGQNYHSSHSHHSDSGGGHSGSDGGGGDSGGSGD